MAASVAPPRTQRLEKSFVIKNFNSKIENYKPGQAVGKDFPLGDKSLKIDVMPNGPSEDFRGLVWLGMWKKGAEWGQEEVKKEDSVWYKVTLAGKTFEGISAQDGMFWPIILTWQECRAGLKSGALEVRVVLELAAKVDCQEYCHTSVKKDAKKVNKGSDRLLKVIEVEEKVQSKKVNIVKEEAVLKYHQIVIDLRVCHLRCSACKTRPSRCKVFQCSAGHLVCEACLPSLKRCAVCNTSLPEPPCRNLCAEQSIASFGEVD